MELQDKLRLQALVKRWDEQVAPLAREVRQEKALAERTGNFKRADELSIDRDEIAALIAEDAIARIREVLDMPAEPEPEEEEEAEELTDFQITTAEQATRYQTHIVSAKDEAEARELFTEYMKTGADPHERITYGDSDLEIADDYTITEVEVWDEDQED